MGTSVVSKQGISEDVCLMLLNCGAMCHIVAGTPRGDSKKKEIKRERRNGKEDEVMNLHEFYPRLPKEQAK